MPKVLVIDQSPTSLNLLGRQLRDFGLEPLVARDGVTGLGMFFEHHPRAALVDLMLSGLDGFAVLRQARAQDRHTPIIIVAADPSPERATRALELGATTVLAKPVSSAELGMVFERAGLATYMPEGSL
jgi:DNA-binding response OmpR family regulator